MRAVRRCREPWLLTVLLLSSAVVGAMASAVPASAQASPASPPGPAPLGNPARGATVYQVCMGCHSLDEDDVGPRHRGVVGRRAGVVEGYAYSPALKASAVVWTADALDRWLANPQAVVPGTKMYFALMSPRDRADVIAYLAEQH